MISRAAVRLRNLPFSTSPTNPLRNLTRLSSSWSLFAAPDAPATATPTPLTEPGGGEVSAAYSDSRKFARPATVAWSEQLQNSISLIGTVEYPPKQCTGKEGMIGAHTILLVKSSPHSQNQFRITLSMWGLLAEQALAHLKPNDFIYVSGQLGSYTKSDLGGTEKLYYKVKANELNYVQVPEGNYQVAAKSGSEAGENREDKRRNRLILWQLLFTNPDEWYDQRKTKKSSRQPDFKHKSTGEALWLNQDDPSWVKKQIELLDSRLAGGQNDDQKFMSFSSNWVSGEHLPASDCMKDNPNYISIKE